MSEVNLSMDVSPTNQERFYLKVFEYTNLVETGKTQVDIPEAC